MVYHIIGKKTGSFTDRKTGEVIEYSRIYVTSPFEVSVYDDGPVTEGLQAIEVKAPIDVVKGLEIDQDVKLLFNMKGRLEEVILV